MRRFSIRRVFPSRERIPFWQPWGVGRWGGWTFLFLLLLLLYLLLFCLPNRSRVPVEPEPGPDPIPHTGDVQVLLEWETADDLDLHVIDPAGEEIYYEHEKSASGGELDVDANARRMMLHPKENVYWPVGAAPKGKYEVSIVWYSQKSQDLLVPYQVTVKYGGREEHYSGTLRSVSQTDNVCTFVLE